MCAEVCRACLVAWRDLTHLDWEVCGQLRVEIFRYQEGCLKLKIAQKLRSIVILKNQLMNSTECFIQDLF